MALSSWFSAVVDHDGSILLDEGNDHMSKLKSTGGSRVEYPATGVADRINYRQTCTGTGTDQILVERDIRVSSLS